MATMETNNGTTIENQFDYSNLEPWAIHGIKINGKKYVLREPSSGAATKYKNCLAASARIEDGKVTGVQSVGEVEPVLVSECLFEEISAGVEKPVDVGVVRGFRPGRITKELFDEIMRRTPWLREKDPQEGDGPKEQQNGIGASSA